MEGGRAAAARNVSSTTRVGNSQSSGWAAAFPHPWLPGREGQGEFGIRREVRSGLAHWKGIQRLGGFRTHSVHLLEFTAPSPKSWNCNLLVFVDTSASPHFSIIRKCCSCEMEKWLFGGGGKKWPQETGSVEQGAYVLRRWDSNWCSTILRGLPRLLLWNTSQIYDLFHIEHDMLC